ncbi:uncharacterized protein LOC111258723 [Varroa jacobsoni]|uniref:uncharacterized protein LOC111258723 n=1 Tax=Varroa jacobsoni TaxID=62625 RepID=UPI000BF3CDCC|nr:uncharacterized protein LOC111258723 [Varroa jacobsoni]
MVFIFFKLHLSGRRLRIANKVAVKAGHATRIANEEGNVSAVTAGADSRICCLADRHEEPRHKMTTDLNACSGIPRKGTFDSTKSSRFIEYVSSYRGKSLPP